MSTTNKDCTTQCDAWRELDPHLTDEIKGALAASNRHLRAEQMGVDYLFDIHRVLMRDGALIVAGRGGGYFKAGASYMIVDTRGYSAISGTAAGADAQIAWFMADRKGPRPDFDFDYRS